MLTATIFALALVQQQPTSGQDPEKQHDTAWAKYLTTLAKQERVQIVFDCTPMGAPPSPGESMGAFGLDVLARRANRLRTEIDGVQVFARKQPTGREEPASSVLEVLQLISGLEPDKLQKLCTDGINLSELSPDQQVSLLLALPIDAADCTRIMRGEPVKIALDLFASYEFKAPGSGNAEKGTLLGDRFGGWFAQSAAEGSQAKPLDPLSRPGPGLARPPVDGDLDFGEGSIVTLREAIAKASETFDARYFVDSRLHDSKYFFSGRFTQKRFEDTVTAITKVVPLTNALPPDDLPSHRDYVRELKGALAKSTTQYNKYGQLAMINRSLNATELAGTSRAFASRINSLNLGGKDFNVSLTPEIALAVYMPASDTGKHVAFRLSLGKLGD